jgi:c-di-GMP-binding flagellar brake protein YcgR
MQSASERLRIGQRLKLQIEGRWFASRLEDINGNQLSVAWPTDRGSLVLLKPGESFELAASTPQDALYSATTQIVSVTTEPVPLVRCRVVGQWRRSQRREAVRMPVAIRPRLAVRLAGGDEQPLLIGITNISATGLQIRSQDRINPGDELELAFELIGVPDELSVRARVKRVESQERIWIAGCAFEGLPDRTARTILQFIFAQQRAEIARQRRIA